MRSIYSIVMIPFVLSLVAVVPSALNVPTVPLFQIRPWEEVTESTIEITVPSWTESLGFRVREKTEIKVGDLIRAVVKNPQTGKNISESNVIDVQF